MAQLISNQDLKNIREQVREDLARIKKDLPDHTYQIKVDNGKIFKEFLDGRREYVGRA